MFNLPLKQSRPIEFTKPIQQFIITAYSEAQLYEDCKLVFEKTERLRRNLDYEKINLSIATDPQTSQDLENNLLDYLKHFTLLAKHLRFEPGDPKSPQLLFLWSDSYDQKRQTQLNNGKYELVCQFYNYAITQYYIATNRLLKETDADRKQAISKLRNGLWALDQLKPLIHGVQAQSIAQQYDLQMMNLEFLDHFFAGLCYKSLYQNMSQQLKTFGAQNVAGTLFEGAKEFQITLTIIKEMNNQWSKVINKNLLQQMQCTVQFNYVWSIVQASIQVAAFHYDKIQDESRGQNMGKALGFLSKAQVALDTIMQDKNASKVYSPQQIDVLKQLQTQFQTVHSEYNYKNQQIYKEQIAQEAMLPVPPILEQLRIKPLQPPAFAEPIEGHDKFSGFVSEEGLQMSREIKMYVDQTRYSLDESLKMLHDQKNKAYAENYVTYFIDMYHQSKNNQSSQAMPQSVKDKVEYIRSRGGVAGMETLVQQQKQVSITCAQILGQIEQCLIAEQKDDEQARQRFGAQWNRNTSLQLNVPYNQTLNDLKVKYGQAQKIDFDVIGGFEKSKVAIRLAEQADSVIIQSLPKQENSGDFVATNIQLFNQLISVDVQMQQQCDELKQVIFQFMEIMNSTNYSKLAVDGLNQGTSKDQICSNALQPVGQLIEAFNEKMNQVSTYVGQICGIATELQKQKRTTTSNSQQDNGSAGFLEAQQAIDNIDHSIIFYQQLIQYLEDLDRKVKDHVMARNIEKDEKIAQLSQNKPQPQQPPHQQQPIQPLPGQQQQQQQQYPYPPYPQNPQYPNQNPNPQQQYGQYPQQGYPQYPQQQQNYQQQPYPQQGNYQYPNAQNYYPQQSGQWGQQYPPQKK